MPNSVEITDNTEEVKAKLLEKIERGLIACGLAAEGHAKQALTDQKAVDTGRLRNSITNQVDMSEQAVYIGTNVEYAAYVELGTSRMRARPYLRPAAQNHGSEYQELLRQAMEADS